jgi:tRNA(Ile)-lysidine synthase
VLERVRKHNLLRPGDRVGLAVSGGADSVSLLRALLELREETGLVLTVLHFNHRIREPEADEDEAFVRKLSERMKVEFVRGEADTRSFAKQQGLSLEAAARQLRYNFFNLQISSGAITKVATAHTMDDQAETVLLRLLRGSGMKGLRGVHQDTGQGIIRPLLGLSRQQLEHYLRSLHQDWCDDVTNLDTQHLRNRVRHKLMPLLAREYNPNIIETLARTAEIAAAEEELLAAETERILPLVLLPGKPVRGGGRTATAEGFALDLEKLTKQPVAMQRRLVRALAERFDVHLDFDQVENALSLPPGGRLSLSPKLVAVRTARELRIEPAAAPLKAYSYPLPVPGEVLLKEMNIVVRAGLVSLDTAESRGTLDGQTLSPSAVLLLRSWKAGDRYQQAFSSSAHKVKELLNEIQPPEGLRARWPVIEVESKVVWVMGARNRPLLTSDGKQIVIETEEPETV